MKPYSSSILSLSGIILIGLGMYFVFLRPPLLPEDPRYIGASLSVIQDTLPGLALWLQKVFWVMGGYIISTGLLMFYVARTGFRARGAWAIIAFAGLASIGWMTLVNFILHSDFKWILLMFSMVWAVALVLFWMEK